MLSGGLRDAISWAFWLGATVWWIDILALEPYQLALMGIFLEGTVLLAETPTGVVADLYSRKWSIVVSYALMGIGFIWAVASFNFWVILPAQVIFGIGWTFQSGADVAWVTDELRGSGQAPTPEEGDADDVIEPLLMRRHRVQFMLGIVALILMIFIGRHDVRLAIAISGAAMLALAGLIAWIMPENHFAAQHETSSFRSTLTRGLGVIRRVPRIRILVITALLMEFGGEAVDRFGMKRFIDGLDVGQDSFIVTGVLFIVLALAGLGVNLVVSRQMEQGRRLPALAAILLGIAALGAVVTALGPTTAIIGLGVMIQDATRESAYSVFTGWANRDAPSEVRATVHSLVGQMGAFGEILGAIALGAVAQWIGISTSVVISGLLFLLAATTAAQAMRLPSGTPVP